MFAIILHSISVSSFYFGVPWRSLDIQRGWRITQVARVMISLCRLWVTVRWETHLAEAYYVSERSMAMVFASWNGVHFEYRGFPVPLFIRHSSPLEVTPKAICWAGGLCGQRDAVLLDTGSGHDAISSTLQHNTT